MLSVRRILFITSLILMPLMACTAENVKTEQPSATLAKQTTVQPVKKTTASQAIRKIAPLTADELVTKLCEGKAKTFQITVDIQYVCKARDKDWTGQFTARVRVPDKSDHTWYVAKGKCSQSDKATECLWNLTPETARNDE